MTSGRAIRAPRRSPAADRPTMELHPTMKAMTALLKVAPPPSAVSPPSAERERLAESDARTVHWKKWGPYLSERAWGTVREDYSSFGQAWDYFPHDHARSRAYRWNEDGIA